MKSNASLLVIFIVFVFSCKTQSITDSPTTNIEVEVGKNGIIERGTVKGGCKPAEKNFYQNMDLGLKASLDSLSTLPKAEIDAHLKRTGVSLAQNSQKGLDFDKILYRICEISTLRGYTSKETNDFTKAILNAYSEEKKKNLD